MAVTSVLLYGNHDLIQLKECISSIKAAGDNQNYEIVLIVSSNESSDNMDWYLEQTELLISVSSDSSNLPKCWNEALSIAKGEHILFIDSQALVTAAWLPNMIEDLAHTPEAGIIAPVTNAITENQTIEARYKSYEELNLFSYSLYEQKPEQVLMVAELCFLFERRLINEIGLFDQQLFEGAFMFDFCLRAYQAGYKSFVSHKTFVHFNNGYFEKLQENQDFRWKWSFTEEALKSDSYLIEQTEIHDDESDLLFLGIQCGASVLKMNSKYPNINVYGMELNPFKHNIASLLPYTIKGDFFEQLQFLKSKKFRKVMISPHFFESSSGADMLNLILKELHEDAEVFLELNNDRHYKKISNLIAPEKECRLGYEESLRVVVSLLRNNHFYESHAASLTDSVSIEDKKLYEGISELTIESDKRNLLVTKTFTHFRRRTHLEKLFQKLSSGLSPELLEDLIKYDSELLLSSLKENKMQETEIFNHLASIYIQYNQYKSALDMLEYSYSLNSQNDHTLLNLGMVYYLTGNDQKALTWFEKIVEKTDQVLKWIDQLNARLENEQNSRKLVLKLLLRIEYNVLIEHSLKSLIESIEEASVTEDQIAFFIDRYIISKSQVFNQIAVYLYNENKLEIGKALLKKAVDQYQATDTTFLYLAFILIKSGDFSEAYYYLDTAPQQSERIQEWKEKIRHNLRQENQ